MAVKENMLVKKCKTKPIDAASRKDEVMSIVSHTCSNWISVNNCHLMKRYTNHLLLVIGFNGVIKVPSNSEPM